VTFEDGRKGGHQGNGGRSATCHGCPADAPIQGGRRMNVHIREDLSGHVKRADDGIKKGDVMLRADNVSLSFGGVKAIKDVSFDITRAKSVPSSGPTAPARHRC
jgi:hypothetical protein